MNDVWYAAHYWIMLVIDIDRYVAYVCIMSALDSEVVDYRYTDFFIINENPEIYSILVKGATNSHAFWITNL